MRALPHLLLLMLLALPGAPLPAAEAEEEATDEAPPAETADAEAGEQQEAPDEDADAGIIEDDSFVPSVQISEDLSVSFPTDI